MRKKTKSWIAVAMAAVMLCGCGTTVSESTGTSEETGTDTAGVSEYPDYLNLESQRPIVKDGEKITLRVLT